MEILGAKEIYHYSARIACNPYNFLYNVRTPIINNGDYLTEYLYCDNNGYFTEYLQSVRIINNYRPWSTVTVWS